MSLTFGFYNSVSGDRTYDAIQVSKMFDGVLTDGIFPTIGDKLVVTDGTGMTVVVGTGKAWFNNTWTTNDADLILNISPSDLVLPRIDSVIIEINASNAVRANTIKVLTGTPATIPVEPTLTNTSEVHQYRLANISIAAGITEIIPANVTDLVGTINCPYVTVPQAGIGNVAGVLQMQIFT